MLGVQNVQQCSNVLVLARDRYKLSWHDGEESKVQISVFHQARFISCSHSRVSKALAYMTVPMYSTVNRSGAFEEWSRGEL